MKNKCDCLCHILPSSSNNQDRCLCCLTCELCGEKIIENYKIVKHFIEPECKEYIKIVKKKRMKYYKKNHHSYLIDYYIERKRQNEM